VKEPTLDTPPQPDVRRHDAVVIGASAGGIEALGQLLPGLPAGYALPVLVVLHLPPQRTSQLAALFGSRCRVPVREAQDKEPIQPGTVYFAPPDYHLLVEPDFTLALSVDPPVNYSRPAIDVLFESAAAAYAERLLAIVLTGASVDGSQGVAAVLRAGGTTWVQDPATAAHATMPAAALRVAGAQAACTLEDMGKQLACLEAVATPFRLEGLPGDTVPAGRAGRLPS
jgi:two-component system chemotaxis response regulator CheB